jgi:ATP-binding cassette subfamily C protein LapB
MSPSASQCLSRLAALQGKAIPASRFEFQSSIGQGVNPDQLDLTSRLVELWLSVLPTGEVKQHRALPPRDRFPLLWTGPSPDASESTQAAQRLLLLRGITSQKIIIEEGNGAIREIMPSDLSGGTFIELRLTKIDSPDSEDKITQRSASAWFLHAIYTRRRVFLEAALATLLVGLFGLAASLYTMQVYDRVIPLKGYSTLAVLTFGVLLAIALELLMKQVRASMTERSCKAIDQELSDVFFSKALSIRLDARPRTVGTFASQIRHFESVRGFMTSATLLVLADIPLALLFVVIIGLIAGWVALVPLLAVPLALSAGLLFKKPLRRLTQQQIQESNVKNGLLIESIDGIESLKASGAEWKVQGRWNELTRLLSAKELKLRLLTNFSTQLSQTVHQLSYVGIVAFGAYAVAEGNLTMGGLIACSIIASRALQPIAQLPAILTQWHSAAVSLEALDGIMRMPDDREASQHMIVPEGCGGALRLEKAVFRYDPSQSALEIERLNIAPGEKIAVLGSIGSGKSTLMKILAGLYLPTQGKIFLDDVDMFQIASEFVREHVAYLPQDVRLFNGTLRENLILGLPNPTDAVILEAAKACGLAASIARHPKGLELMIQEGGRGLSGGQRQLVGLTRMLIAKPKILLLDEPTASMDPQMETYVLHHLFERLPKSTTVVMATHKAASLRYIDRLIVLQQSKIALDGPRDDVLKALNSSKSSANERPIDHS